MTFRPTCFRAAFLSLLLVACAQEPTLPPEQQYTEPPVRISGTPLGWNTGTHPAHDIGIDQTQQRSGTAAAYIFSASAPNTMVRGLTQFVRADDFRGRRLRLTGWLRVKEAGSGAYLLMRVDGPGTTLALGDMASRPLVADSEWQQASVVLDVPQSAIGIVFGAELGGQGDVIIDDLRLDTVGPDVPVTDVLTAPVPAEDSATVAAFYEARRAEPVNLDFEGIDGPSQATVDYLRAAAVPFAGTDPAASDADLEPLRDMIGSARVVGLGEGTHGTREFFLMKHRILEYLVRQMGFTVFAIEATSPESDLVNDYVLDGKGDPATLLSNLYFWTWNTQEVLDMIEWMRQWNLTAPPDRRVQFRGFDMQYPGMAMDSVMSFIRAVDPDSARYVADRFLCLAGYRNHGYQWPPSPDTAYANRSAAFRDACHAGLQDVYHLLDTRRADYEAASSPARFAQALHSARLVQQFEEMSGSTFTAGANLRDAFMAENTLWLLDQAGPGAHMVLWAHNAHISRSSGAMGDSIGRVLGDAYVNVGFLFGRGSFNALDQRTMQGLQSWQTDYIPDDAIEAVFTRTNQPRLLFDARGLADGGAPAKPLRASIRMRSIGATFNPDTPDLYFSPHLFPRFFDLLLYVEGTTPSTLLPFVF